MGCDPTKEPGLGRALPRHPSERAAAAGVVRVLPANPTTRLLKRCAPLPDGRGLDVRELRHHPRRCFRLHTHDHPAARPHRWSNGCRTERRRHAQSERQGTAGSFGHNRHQFDFDQPVRRHNRGHAGQRARRRIIPLARYSLRTSRMCATSPASDRPRTR